LIVCLPALLQQCEDLEDMPSLHHMFRLMRSIIMLNDTQVRASTVQQAAHALQWRSDEDQRST
jgi:hypothetical protein